MWRAFGFRASSSTTHPGMIAYRTRSPLWKLKRALPKVGQVLWALQRITRK
jgi:hypothetical protein